jgi:S-adenosylmethionine decarboxylase
LELSTGVEWVVDAFDCDVERLRDQGLIKSVCEQVVDDLGLKVIGRPQVHRFGGPGGVTALFMLSESHLACHTYPEHRLATFNLYCCRQRRSWDWQERLGSMLLAGSVTTRQITRGGRRGDGLRHGDIRHGDIRHGDRTAVARSPEVDR